jgi:hypothetical protein
MTMPSRGISSIQRKATGDDMKCGMKKGGDARKGMLKNKSKAKTKMDLMNVGAAESAGKIPGYYKGGKVDGCIKKGHTKGKVV